MVYIFSIVCLAMGGVLGRWLGWPAVVWVGLSLALGLLTLWLIKYQQERLVGLSLVLGCLLAARMVTVLPDPAFQVESVATGSSMVSGVVSGQPKQSNKSIQVRLDQVVVERYSGQWQGAIQLTMPVHSLVSYGDQLKLHGRLEGLDQLDSGYAEYLRNQQIYSTMLWPEVVEQVSSPSRDLLGWGIWIQQESAWRLERLLPQDLAAFLLGILLGADRLLSEEFDEALKVTGTSHVVVASGYNVGIMVGLAVKLASRWGKYAVGVTAVAMVGSFVLVSGIEPSLVRASLMAGIALLVVMWGRQKQAIYGLVLAGAAMLFVNPWWLFEASFQLSFMATLSLILFQPIVEGYSERFMAPWLSDMVSSTVAAQVLVYPILGVLFGTWSMVSLLTNVAILWLIPWLMLMGLVLVVVGWINLGIAQWLAFGLYPGLGYVRQVIIWSSRLPAASLGLPINWWGAGLYYGVMAVLYQRMNYEQTS